MLNNNPLSKQRAEELLKIMNGAAAVKMFNTCGNHSYQHAQRGTMIRLVGKDKAEVKPEGHRRTEIVPLSDLSEWKSGNHKRNIIAGRSVVAKPGRLIAAAGGLDRPSELISIAAANPPSPKELEPKESEPTEVLQTQRHPAPSSPKIVTPPPVPLRINPPSTVETKPPAASMPQVGSPEFGAILAESSKIDFASIEKDDPTLLVVAAEERKQATSELLEARTIFVEAFAKYKAKEEAYQAAVKAFVPSSAIVPQVVAPSGGKKGNIKKAVLAYISQHSGQRAIDQISNEIGATIESAHSKGPVAAVRQCLLALEKEGIVAKDANGLYSISAKN